MNIGIDIVEIARLKTRLQRNPGLTGHVLTPSENKRYKAVENERKKFEFLAGRIAAKEAFFKALGTGITEPVHLKNVEILNRLNGAPFIQVNNPDILPQHQKTSISISHEENYATAVVLICGVFYEDFDD